MNKEIRRGDLYYAELDPIVGSEQAGTRPVLVVSNDIGNQYSPVIVIVPITSRRIGKKQLPTHVEVRYRNCSKTILPPLQSKSEPSTSCG